MSKRKPKPRRNEVAQTYGRFVLAAVELLELRELPLLSDGEREKLDRAYALAGEARSAFEERTGARQAWDDEWRDIMRTKTEIVLDDREPRPILEPEAAE